MLSVRRSLVFLVLLLTGSLIWVTSRLTTVSIQLRSIDTELHTLRSQQEPQSRRPQPQQQQQRPQPQQEQQQQQLEKDDRHSQLLHNFFIPILYSFPGSGSTFSRQLIDFALQGHSGSIYSDPALEKVFPKESRCTPSQTVTKVHINHCPPELAFNRSFNVPAAARNSPVARYWTQFCMFSRCGKPPDQAFDAAVVIIRHPVKTLLAQFNFDHTDSSHTEQLSENRVNSGQFVQFLHQYKAALEQMWQVELAKLDHEMHDRVLVVLFEHLVDPDKRVDTLARITAFLRPDPVPRERLAAAFDHADTFKRKKTYASDGVLITDELLDYIWRPFYEKAPFSYTKPILDSPRSKASTIKSLVFGEPALPLLVPSLSALAGVSNVGGFLSVMLTALPDDHTPKHWRAVVQESWAKQQRQSGPARATEVVEARAASRQRHVLQREPPDGPSGAALKRQEPAEVAPDRPGRSDREQPIRRSVAFIIVGQPRSFLCRTHNEAFGRAFLDPLLKAGYAVYLFFYLKDNNFFQTDSPYGRHIKEQNCTQEADPSFMDPNITIAGPLLHAAASAVGVPFTLKINTEPQDTEQELGKSCLYDWRLLLRLRQWHPLREAFKMLVEHEQRQGWRFDAVVRIRPDMRDRSKAQSGLLATVQAAFTPEYEHLVAFDADFTAVMRRHLAEVYFTADQTYKHACEAAATFMPSLGVPKHWAIDFLYLLHLRRFGVGYRGTRTRNGDLLNVGVNLTSITYHRQQLQFAKESVFSCKSLCKPGDLITAPVDL